MIARAAFVISKDGVVKYAEQTPTPKDLPNFAAVKAALAKNPQGGIHMGDYLFVEKIAIAVKKGNTELAAAIDNDGEGAPRVDLATMANPEVLRAVMADEIDPPALTHDDSEGAPFSGEAFGTREREPVTRGATDTEQKPEATQRRPRAAAAPRSAPAPAPTPGPGVAPGPDDQGQQTPAGLQASFEGLLARMKAAKDEDARAQLLDLARSSEISAVQFDELRALYLQLKG